MRNTLTCLAFALMIASAPVLAADPPVAPTAPTATPLPAWEQLTPAQRETLLAPIRDRWNTQPDERARMLERAQRWQQMTQIGRAHV